MISDLKCFYVEGNNDPEDSMIVFSKTSIEAKRDWANEHGDGDRHIAGISAKRRKEWDQFAPGPVPSMELLEAGWWMECHGCGVRVSDEDVGTSAPYTNGYDYEDFALDREYGPDLTLPIMQPYEPSLGCIFCRKECFERHEVERRRIKTMERRVAKIMAAAIVRKFSDAALIGKDNSYWSPHIYVSRSNCGRLLVHQAVMSFLRPGMTYGATLRVDDEKWRYGRQQVPCARDYRGYRDVPIPISERERRVEWTVANGDKAVWDALAEGKRAA